MLQRIKKRCIDIFILYVLHYNYIGAMRSYNEQLQHLDTLRSTYVQNDAIIAHLQKLETELFFR